MSTDEKELLVTTSQFSEQFSACLWDYDTKNVLQTYRSGGIVHPKTLAVLGNDFILTADQRKPLLHVWPVNSQEQVKNHRFVLPDLATSLAVSPTKNFIAVGIGVKLYVWHLSSGKLLSITQKHLQAITCVKFSNDSTYLIVTGADGMLVTYRFANLVSLDNNYLAQSQLGQTEPLYSRLDHSMPILDVHVGSFGAKSRVATVSSDQTCRLYDLIVGELLLTLIFAEPLTSVIFTNLCWDLFVGSNTGTIRKFRLNKPSTPAVLHVDEEKETALTFIGHKAKITCLDLNATNKRLASGGEDNQVLIWEVGTRHILHVIEHKAVITNVMFLQNHENMLAQLYKPERVLKLLQRNVDLEDKSFVTSVVQTQKIIFADEDNGKERESDVGAKLKHVEEELLRAKVVNKQLYETLIKVNENLNT